MGLLVVLINVQDRQDAEVNHEKAPTYARGIAKRKSKQDIVPKPNRKHSTAHHNTNDSLASQAIFTSTFLHRLATLLKALPACPVMKSVL